MKINIKDLRLRAIIGINEWERHKKQDVVLTIQMVLRDDLPAKTDRLEDSVDYKAVTKRIIDAVERSEFLLIERLAGFVLDLIFEQEKVLEATVEVDKPHALRFADSVSAVISRSK